MNWALTRVGMAEAGDCTFHYKAFCTLQFILTNGIFIWIRWKWKKAIKCCYDMYASFVLCNIDFLNLHSQSHKSIQTVLYFANKKTEIQISYVTCPRPWSIEPRQELASLLHLYFSHICPNFFFLWISQNREWIHFYSRIFRLYNRTSWKIIP